MDMTKPKPKITATSEPFWEGLKRREILLQRCDECQQWIYYPRARCNSCLSDRLTWTQTSGAVTLYTYTISHVPTAPHFADEVPQVLAVAELAEGPHVTTTLTGIEHDQIKIGMALAPVFEPIDDEVTLLRFTAAQ